MSVLRTPRLEGRPITPRDWPLLAEILSAPEAARWLRPGAQLEKPEIEHQAKRAALSFAESWSAHGFGPHVWRLGPRAVGYAGLRRSDLDARDAWEAFWGMLPSQQGRGYATEAMRAVLDAQPDGLVLSWALPANAASRRVMEKLGMTYEGLTDWKGFEHVVYRLER